jgi:hypothetical protein
MAKYIESLCEQTQMDRSGIHNWRYIGEVYSKYRKKLEKTGFSDADGPAELPYVEQVLALYQKKDVFRAVKSMSLRQFISFFRGEALEPLPESVSKVRGNQIFIEKKLAAVFKEGLDPKTLSYLEDILAEAGEVLYTTWLYDTGNLWKPQLGFQRFPTDELRRFARVAERFKKLWVNYKGKR